MPLKKLNISKKPGLEDSNGRDSPSKSRQFALALKGLNSKGGSTESRGFQHPYNNNSSIHNKLTYNYSSDTPQVSSHSNSKQPSPMKTPISFKSSNPKPISFSHLRPRSPSPHSRIHRQFHDRYYRNDSDYTSEPQIYRHSSERDRNQVVSFTRSSRLTSVPSSDKPTFVRNRSNLRNDISSIEPFRSDEHSRYNQSRDINSRLGNNKSHSFKMNEFISFKKSKKRDLSPEPERPSVFSRLGKKVAFDRSPSHTSQLDKDRINAESSVQSSHTSNHQRPFGTVQGTAFTSKFPKVQSPFNPDDPQFTKKNDFLKTLPPLTKPARCTFFPMCQKQSCLYIHPTVNCDFAEKCPNKASCIFLHPKDTDVIPCKYGVSCSRPDCIYYHQIKYEANGRPTSMIALECEQNPCLNSSCYFHHPGQSYPHYGVQCTFQLECTRPNCFLVHPRKPKTHQGKGPFPDNKPFDPDNFEYISDCSSIYASSGEGKYE